jgi:hypothetical protein
MKTLFTFLFLLVTFNLWAVPYQPNAYDTNTQSAGLTTASVAGMAQLSLWVPGSTTNFSSLLTAIGVVTGTSTNGTLSAFVPAAGTYTFTNTSSGSGDAAFPVNGQILVY